uniref:Secreted protein n=1 Tax=Arion vulgaris TaxID=1028688 RepID=A0A0B7AAW1_9EUPU
MHCDLSFPVSVIFLLIFPPDFSSSSTVIYTLIFTENQPQNQHYAHLPAHKPTPKQKLTPTSITSLHH